MKKQNNIDMNSYGLKHQHQKIQKTKKLMHLYKNKLTESLQESFIIILFSFLSHRTQHEYDVVGMRKQQARLRFEIP